MKKIDWILLVDDDEIDRFVNEKIIRQCDVSFPVHAVQDAYAALEWIKEKATAIVSNKESGLILLDINMPGMSGFEFLQHYKEAYPHLKDYIHVVTLSSSNHRSDRQRMMELGAIAYYSKPLNHEDLKQIMSDEK
jgi:CheY-like chemotaxis protein